MVPSHNETAEDTSTAQKHADVALHLAEQYRVALDALLPEAGGFDGKFLEDLPSGYLTVRHGIDGP